MAGGRQGKRAPSALTPALFVALVVSIPLGDPAHQTSRLNTTVFRSHHAIPIEARAEGLPYPFQRSPRRADTRRPLCILPRAIYAFGGGSDRTVYSRAWTRMVPAQAEEQVMR